MVYTFQCCFIPLRNIEKQIINYTCVDENKYEDVISYKWYLSNGYAYNTKIGLLSRLIVGLRHYNGKIVVDHIDGNKLNNCKFNLRCVTHRINSLNIDKLKKENCSCRYYGLYPSNGKFQLQCGGVPLCHIDNDQYAAFVFNQIIPLIEPTYQFRNQVQFEDSNFNANNFLNSCKQLKGIQIISPGKFLVNIHQDFQLCTNILKIAVQHRNKQLEQHCTDMTGIVPVPKRNRYEIKLTNPQNGKRTYYGMSKNLNEIIIKRDKILQEFQKYKQELPTKQEKQIAKNGGIELLYKKHSSSETKLFQISQNMYEKLKNETFYQDQNDYICFNNYKKYQSLYVHRQIYMWLNNLDSISPKYVIDHQNHDKNNLTNENLRMVDRSVNAHNKIKKNCYVGIKIRNNKVEVEIRNKQVYGKNSIYLGAYSSELEGASAYDMKSNELYGSMPNNTNPTRRYRLINDRLFLKKEVSPSILMRCTDNKYCLIKDNTVIFEDKALVDVEKQRDNH